MELTQLLLIYLLPLGFMLVAWSSWEPERARDQAVVALTAIATAALAYAAIGFGLQFGGVGLRPDVPAGLRGLARLWSPISGSSGQWGLMGLAGFGLQSQSLASGDTALLFTLFLHQLPIVMTAALLPGLALAGRARLSVIAVITILTAGFLVPLAGAWAWGDGWLMTLGTDAKLGHGFIDPGAAAASFTAAGFVTLAALLALSIRRSEATTAPPSSGLSSTLAIIGALIFGLGWLLWLNTDPIVLNIRSIDLTSATTNLVLGVSAATLVTLVIGWFTSGQPSVPLAARGSIGGWIAVTALAPFAPAWAAAVTGLVTGVLVGIGAWAIARGLHLDDGIDAFATAGLSGLWSMLAVGLLADGTFGAGWNNIGPTEYLGVAGQGITGVIAQSNLPNDPGQLTAQITGAVAIASLAFVVTWLLTRPLRSWNARASQGLVEG